MRYELTSSPTFRNDVSKKIQPIASTYSNKDYTFTAQRLILNPKNQQEH